MEAIQPGTGAEAGSGENHISAPPIKTMMVDHDGVSRARMRSLLEEEGGFEVVAECSDTVDAIEEIERKRPDLLFLEVHMPTMSGFDLLRSIQSRAPLVILATACGNHGIRAFDMEALDYLLKPFDRNRVRHALNRVRAAMQARNECAEVEDRRENAPASAYLQRIAVRRRGGIMIVRTVDIDWIEAADNYVTIHVGQEDYLLRCTVASLEARLSPTQFARIHRSTIVNLDRVRALESLPSGERCVVLANGKRLSISRSYRGRLLNL